MNINSRPINLPSDNPYLRGNNAAQTRGRARDVEEEVVARSPAPESVAEAVPVPEGTRAVVPMSDSAASSRRFEYYPAEDLSSYPPLQRKALQLYSSNQGLGRLDPNADYLGAVDTYA